MNWKNDIAVHILFEDGHGILSLKQWESIKDMYAYIGEI
jgi:hypothetical protein